MKKFVLALVMTFMMCASVYAADQEVYINQSGAAADVDIVLDGSGNKIGTSSDITAITGTNQDVDINFTGNTNTLTGDFINTGVATANDLELDVDGSTNQYTIDVGSGGEAVSSSIIEDRDGSSGVVSYRIGTTNVVKNADINVVAIGDDVDIDILENSSDNTTTQKATTITMDTASNDVDIDVDHTGAGIHSTILNIDGSFAGSDITSNQSGAQDTIVNLEVNGATSSDFDITITD
jgi:hypothetical protein